MTIWFPDISHYQAGLKVQPKTVAVIAKATEGTTYADPSYADFKAQAHAHGAVFMAYHFLWSGTPAEAKWAFAHVGKTPLLIDAENTKVKTTVKMILSFVKEYRKLGGVVHMVYLPHWYWQGALKSPDLRPLAKAGLQLVSSNYTTYSDNGPGWLPYGNVRPIQWQYSDNFLYGGRHVDFNAFKGTVAQFKNVITTGLVNPPAPKPPKPPKPPVPTPPPTPTPVKPLPYNTPMTAGMFVEAMRAIKLGKESGPWTNTNYPDLIARPAGAHRAARKFGRKK